MCCEGTLKLKGYILPKPHRASSAGFHRFPLAVASLVVFSIIGNRLDGLAAVSGAWEAVWEAGW